MAKAPARSRTRIPLPTRAPGKALLVADAGTARLLRVTGRTGQQKLLEVATFEQPSARLQPQEMVSDRTGRVFDRGRGGTGPRSTARHGAASDADPHASDRHRFAQRIARRLDVERRKGTLGELTIAAAPKFLGELRTVLSGPTRAAVARELSRDLVRASDAQLLRAVLD